MKIIGINEPAELRIAGKTIRLLVTSMQVAADVDDVVAFSDLTEAISTSDKVYIEATILK